MTAKQNAARISLQQVVDRVEWVKSRVKALEIGSILFVLAAFAIVFFLVETLVDRLVILDRTTRTIAFWSFAAFVVVVVIYVLYLASRRITDIYAARMLERHHPAIGEALTTLSQALHGEADCTVYARDTLARRVAKMLRRIDFNLVVRNRLIALTRILFVFVSILFLATLFAAGDGFWTCLKRSLFPAADIPPPTKTRIVWVDPGEAKLVAGSTLDIRAQLEGEDVGNARVYLSFDGSRWFHVRMRSRGNGTVGVKLKSLRDSFTYFVAAGDTRSEFHRVDVVPAPAVSEIRVLHEYPWYTKRDPFRTSGGDIEALAGSTLTIRIIANRPLSKARLEVVDRWSTVLSIQNNRRSAVGVLHAKETIQYRLHITDVDGFTNPDPPTYRITVRPDRAPEVTITYPPSDHTMAPDEKFSIVVHASDDCGLRALTLVTRKKFGLPESRALPIEENAQFGTFRFDFTLKELGLKAGDSMVYHVRAQDFRPGLPRPSRSEIHVLRIDRPSPEDEALAEKLEKMAEDTEKMDELGLEAEDEEKPPTEEEKKLADAVDKLLALQKDQEELIKKTKDLAKQTDPEARALWEELDALIQEQKKLREETQKPGALASDVRKNSIENRQKELAKKVRTLQQKVREFAKKQDSREDAKKLNESADNLGQAADRMDKAEEALGSRDAENARSAQQEAQSAMERARSSMGQVPDYKAGSAGLERAQELAREQDRLRERTDELREMLKDMDEGEFTKKLEESQENMKRAAKSLGKGQPLASLTEESEALANLQPEEEEPEEQEEPAETPEEIAKDLAIELQKVKAKQEKILESTRTIQKARAKSLTAELQRKLMALSRKQRDLSRIMQQLREKVDEINARIFSWVMRTIEEDMAQLTEFLGSEFQSGAGVQLLQRDVIRKLNDLIESLKKDTPPGGGGGGGGGGKPPLVTFKAQIKLLKQMQTEIRSQTDLYRKTAEENGLSDLQRQVLRRLAERQDYLKIIVRDILEAVQKRPGEDE